MNKVILMGRLARDPDIRCTQGVNSMLIARYTLAVNRRGNSQTADFIDCVAFGKNAEFAEKYLYKGIKILITGRIQTGSYTKEEKRVYTTDIVVDTQEFAESKGSGQGYVQPAASAASSTAAPAATSTAAPAAPSTAAPAAPSTAAPAAPSTAAPAAPSTAAPAAPSTAAPAAPSTAAPAAPSTAAPAAPSTAAPAAPSTTAPAADESAFMNIPEGIEEELPFR